MKRKGLFALLTLGVLAISGILLGSVNKGFSAVRAEEPEISEPAPAFEEKVYTYSDDHGSAKLTLTSETEFTLEIKEGEEEPKTTTGTYSREGNVLTLNSHDSEFIVALDDTTMTFGEYVETYECSVTFPVYEHGKIEVDYIEGHVGDIVTIYTKPNIFYVTESLTVNGTALIEDEEISGKYTFALVEGENKIAAKFVIDKALLGEMSTIVEQASNKDWTNLFSVRNLISLVSFLLNGGLLLAIVRYYVKDKRLEKKVEDKVEETVANVVPESTKKIVIESIEQFVAPYFTKIEASGASTQVIVTTLCRCFALAQENTPEARIAITKELAALQLSDDALITAIQEKIEGFMKEQTNKMATVLSDLARIEENSKQIVEKAQEENAPVEEPKDNGAQYE